MATTYQIITSTVLTTTTASVTFSSIPQTYKDLMVYIVAATDLADTNVNLFVRMNGDSSSNYGSQQMSYYGTGVNYNINSNRSQFDNGPWGSGTTMTANMFASNYMYFANYTNSLNKQVSVYGGLASSSVRAYAVDEAVSYRGTSPITSITIPPYSGNFVAGSSFYLYGIANS
jgi:hypothetical protein